MQIVRRKQSSLRVQEAIERLEAAAKAGGAYGLGMQRHLDGRAPCLPAPPGAALVPVRVRYVGYASLATPCNHCIPCNALMVCYTYLNVPYSPCSRGLGHLPRREMTYTRCACRLRGSVEYQQAFTEDGQRLCMVCLGPVTTCTAPAQVASSPRLLCTGMRKPLPPLTLMVPSLHRMYQQVPVSPSELTAPLRLGLTTAQGRQQGAQCNAVAWAGGAGGRCRPVLRAGVRGEVGAAQQRRRPAQGPLQAGARRVPTVQAGLCGAGQPPAVRCLPWNPIVLSTLHASHAATAAHLPKQDFCNAVRQPLCCWYVCWYVCKG